MSDTRAVCRVRLPAVVAFTTATAAPAVNEMLGRLLGYATSCSTQILLRLTRRRLPVLAGLP